MKFVKVGEKKERKKENKEFMIGKRREGSKRIIIIIATEYVTYIHTYGVVHNTPQV